MKPPQLLVDTPLDQSVARRGANDPALAWDYLISGMSRPKPLSTALKLNGRDPAPQAAAVTI